MLSHNRWPACGHRCNRPIGVHKSLQLPSFHTKGWQQVVLDSKSNAAHTNGPRAKRTLETIRLELCSLDKLRRIWRRWSDIDIDLVTCRLSLNPCEKMNPSLIRETKWHKSKRAHYEKLYFFTNGFSTFSKTKNRYISRRMLKYKSVNRQNNLHHEMQWEWAKINCRKTTAVEMSTVTLNVLDHRVRWLVTPLNSATQVDHYAS